MSMPRQVFDLGPPAPSADDPPVFELAGLEFTCFGVLPAQATKLLALASNTDLGVIQFIEACLPQDDLDRFRGLLESKDIIVDMKTVGDVFLWLVEVYTGRPTQPPATSSNGRSKTGSMSAVGSSSPGSTPPV